MNVQRKPCAFCLSDQSDVKRQQHYGQWFWVQCKECGARGPRVDSKEEAIKCWDDAPRPTPAPYLHLVGRVPLNVVAFPVPKRRMAK